MILEAAAVGFTLVIGFIEHMANAHACGRAPKGVLPRQAETPIGRIAGPLELVVFRRHAPPFAEPSSPRLASLSS